jgi:hypothetical protein
VVAGQTGAPKTPLFRVSSGDADIMDAVGAFADIDRTILEGSG